MYLALDASLVLLLLLSLSRLKLLVAVSSHISTVHELHSLLLSTVLF